MRCLMETTNRFLYFFIVLNRRVPVYRERKRGHQNAFERFRQMNLGRFHDVTSLVLMLRLRPLLD